MNRQPPDTLAVEQDRLQLAQELADDHGAGWAELFKPGSLGCHELLDRTNWIGDMVEQHILNHPSCVQNAEWFALAEQATTALRELYQRVGAVHLGADKPDNGTS